MPSREGSVDPKITGNLVQKFGESLPIPFIKNITVHNTGIDVTLAIYLQASPEQIKYKTRFRTALNDMGLSVYCMLLVSESNSELRNSDKNYNYEKFLKSINKNVTNTSHILNYITPTFYSLPDENRYTNGSLVSKVYGSADPYPLVYRSTFPQTKESLLAMKAGSIAGPLEPRPYLYNKIEDLTSYLQTNTYKINLNEFEVSEVLYSKDETPIIVMSVTKTIHDNHAATIFKAHPAAATLPEFEKVYASFSDVESGEYTEDRFFGIKNYISFGINKIGLVSFSSMLSNLDTGFDAFKGVQNAFRASKDSTKFYKSLVSDISHTQIMENGVVMNSEMFVFEDQAGNLVEKSNVLQSINSLYYAQDNIQASNIIEALQELIVVSPETMEAQKLMDSLSYILTQHGNEVDLLPQLNKFRTQIPDRATTTPEGSFYESLKTKISNANQIVMSSRELKRFLIKNPVLTDIRIPISPARPYKVRDDYFATECRYKNVDNSVEYPSIIGSSDFIPFIYLNGHEMQGQIALDPYFNPLTVPSAFRMAPYFARDELGFYDGTETIYNRFVDMFDKFYRDISEYNIGVEYVRRIREMYPEGLYMPDADGIGEPIEGEGGFLDENIASDVIAFGGTFEDYLAEKGYSTAEVSQMIGFKEYLDAVLKPGFDLEAKSYESFAGDNFDLSDYSGVDSSMSSQASNNKFTLVENGHFSFDYEKAIGTMSNISMAFNTQKIDNFFGRDLLQSKFRVKRAVVEVHAMVLPDPPSMAGSGPFVTTEPDGSSMAPTSRAMFSTYDSSPPVVLTEEGTSASHINIGRIVAKFDNANDGNPVVTHCEIFTPSFYDSIETYHAELSRRTSIRISGLASRNIGSELEYQLRKNMLKHEILTGHTVGAPNNIPEYETFYDTNVSAGTEGRYTTEYDNARASLITGNEATILEKTQSYIALRNLGGIYHSFDPPGDFMVRQHPIISAPRWYDGDYTTHSATWLLDKTGNPRLYEETESYATALSDFINFNYLSYTPPSDALNSPLDYRLMTFEVQKVGIIKEEDVLTKTGLGDSVANLLAFNAGILPDQVLDIVNNQFYEYFIEVEDNTDYVYNLLVSDFAMYRKELEMYLNACKENCVYNQGEKSFNDFFVNGAEAKYESDPSLAPWIRAPILFMFHTDLLFNTFGGDRQQIITMAEGVSVQISPRTGTLEAIQSFVERFIELYDNYYGATAVSTEGTPAYAYAQYAGKSRIDFGRAPVEASSDTSTSGYVLIGSDYTYSGYSTEFSKGLQDAYAAKEVWLDGDTLIIREPIDDVSIESDAYGDDAVGTATEVDLGAAITTRAGTTRDYI